MLSIVRKYLSVGLFYACKSRILCTFVKLQSCMLSIVTTFHSYIHLPAHSPTKITQLTSAQLQICPISYVIRCKTPSTNSKLRVLSSVFCIAQSVTSLWSIYSPINRLDPWPYIACHKRTQVECDKMCYLFRGGMHCIESLHMSVQKWAFVTGILK